MTIIEAIDQLNDALRRKRDRARRLAEEAREAAEAFARSVGGFPLGTGLDFGEPSPVDRYEFWTHDTIWDRYRRRFISREQWQRQVREYYERQARLLAQQGGGD